MDRADSATSSSKRWFSYVILGALVFMTLVNTYEFNDLEDRAPGAYRVLHSYGATDLREIAGAHGPTVRRRFRFYLELREFAQGATVIMPRGTLAPEHFYGLARVGAVVIREYDESVSLETEELLTQLATYVGEIRGVGECAIVVGENMDDPSMREFLVLRGSVLSLYVVERRALEELEGHGRFDG